MGRGEFLEFDDGKPVPIVDEKKEPLIRDHNFYVERATEAMYAGQPETALKYYSRALEQCLQLEEAWLGQCMALLDMGEYGEAATWAERAMQHCPGSGPCFAARAVANGRMGFKDKAFGFLESAMKTKRDHWALWISRAEILLISNQLANVDYCIRKAVEVGGAPRWWIMRRAGEMALLHDHPNIAINCFLKAIEWEPKEPMNLLRLAQTYTVNGRKKDALDYVERALALKPGMEQALRLREKLDGMGFFKALFKRIGS